MFNLLSGFVDSILNLSRFQLLASASLNSPNDNSLSYVYTAASIPLNNGAVFFSRLFHVYRHVCKSVDFLTLIPYLSPEFYQPLLFSLLPVHFNPSHSILFLLTLTSNCLLPSHYVFYIRV